MKNLQFLSRKIVYKLQNSIAENHKPMFVSDTETRVIVGRRYDN